VFEKLLVCNRGEVAVRIIRTCRELGIRTVAAYSTADRDSLAVRLADEAVCVGPGPVGGSYLNIPAMLYACAKTGADAVHPGYGLLSENALFASSCQAVGVTFIGPPTRMIALMGDKIHARAAAREAGLTVLPGSDGAVADAREVAAIAGRIGYPVLLKAAAGGGGRGIALVRDPGEIGEVFSATRTAAQTGFQDDRLYVEQFLAGAHHIEVQILADAHGNVVHLGERDCSVQRHRQKLVEETPSPFLTEESRRTLCDAAVKASQELGFVSAGTLEFLVDAQGDAHFIEMNARLQVEHTISEQRSGIDIVECMIRVAAGEHLPWTQSEVTLAGHAIEARINAEDAGMNWAGSCGRIDELLLPGGFGVRVDTHAFVGYEVPPYYDALLAKIVVHGRDRDTAVRRLDRALDEFHCAGVVTNVDFQRQLARHPDFLAGRYGLDIVASMVEQRIAVGAAPDRHGN
jgi:acetyl-CoA carboxylase, biotin carboxylase subunit